MSLPNGEKVHTFVAFAHPELQFRRSEETVDGAVSRIASKSDTTRHTASGGRIYQFNFGGLAFWNATDEEVRKEIGRLMRGHDGIEVDKAIERYAVIENPNVGPRVDFSALILDQLTETRAEVVAATLAQSSAMEYYEKLSDQMWADLSGMVESLKNRGTVSPFPGRLHKKIGSLVTMRGSIVGVLHLLDRPDLVWDDRIMDEQYNDLRKIFDLPERFQAIEYKLGWIQDTLEILLDTARDRRLFWLEIAIVFFFFVEISLTFVKFVRP